VVKFIRDFLDARGFIEIETPVLIKSTPEGARDYLVPSRIHAGKFYALPQSPQQLKQLLMVAGYDRYFQIARCFRDEDPRADRQPEFTQLDLEMSFVDEDDVLNLMEELFTSLVETIMPQMRVTKPFPRLSYAEVMERYGNDKPDLRFGLELADLSDIFASTEFSVFRSVIGEGGKVKGFAAPDCANYSPDNVRSVVAKFLTAGQIVEITKRLGAKMGDLLLIVADKPKIVDVVLSSLRSEIAQRLGLIDPNLLAFAFVQDYPLFELNRERWGLGTTISCATAPRSPADRSGYMTVRSRKRCFRFWDIAGRRPRKGLGISWRPWSTVLPRMEVSPRESTAS